MSGGATRIRLPKPHSGRGPIIQDRSCKEVIQLVVIALKVALKVKLSRVGDVVMGVSPPVNRASALRYIEVYCPTIQDGV